MYVTNFCGLWLAENIIQKIRTSVECDGLIQIQNHHQFLKSVIEQTILNTWTYHVKNDGKWMEIVFLLASLALFDTLECLVLLHFMTNYWKHMELGLELGLEWLIPGYSQLSKICNSLERRPSKRKMTTRLTSFCKDFCDPWDSSAMTGQHWGRGSFGLSGIMRFTAKTACQSFQRQQSQVMHVWHSLPSSSLPNDMDQWCYYKFYNGGLDLYR